MGVVLDSGKGRVVWLRGRPEASARRAGRSVGRGRADGRSAGVRPTGPFVVCAFDTAGRVVGRLRAGTRGGVVGVAPVGGQRLVDQLRDLDRLLDAFVELEGQNGSEAGLEPRGDPR